MPEQRLRLHVTEAELKPRRSGTLSPAYGETKKPQGAEADELLNCAGGEADAGNDQ